ncbi:MAG: ATP-binding protein, partial [Flavobacteriaceae bacterium]|nr:ATP-binding protein [Flavobacteriaceae bacterium]
LLLLESEGTKIKNIGFLDNGTGMSKDVLWKSVTVGGRFEELKKNIKGRRGKYGFGLPGSSAGYNEKVEVYTWGKKTNGKVLKVELDLSKINKGIKEPEESELPEPYKSFYTKKASLKTGNEFVFKERDFESSGTLVHWIGCERVKPVTTKVLVERYLNPDLGRIFRHFITDDTYSREKWNKCNIYLAYGFEPGRKIVAQRLLPNDPLCSMPDHFYKQEGIDFQLKEEFSKSISLNNTDITVRFSLVSKDVFDKFKGSRKYKRMAKNTGISIVREGREIDLSDFSYFDPFEQRHRWWGCEIFFDKPADEYFRVPANKQYVEGLKQALETEDGEEFSHDSDYHEWPIWLTLERKFNLKSILSGFLKEIKGYPSATGKDTDDDDGTTKGDDRFGGGSGSTDLPDDPSESGEESTSGDKHDVDKVYENAREELKKVGIDNPTKEQLDRFLNHSVVLSYIDLGENAGFISISLAYGVCHLKINTASKLYQYVLGELRNRDEEGLDDVYRGIELMLLSYARAMDLRRNYENAKEFPRVLRSWSLKVEEFVEQYFEDE